MKTITSMILAWFLFMSFAATAAERALHQPDYDGVAYPSLPRVLLIGDSISMGYTPIVQAFLTDQVNVHRPNANCGSTRTGMRDLDKWLDGKHWDMIHFNFGLHDMRFCYSNEYDNIGTPETGYPTSETGAPRVSLKEYEQNLRWLVKRLKSTGAHLIWASTTPLGAYYHGRDPALIPQYNAVSERVMKEEGIEMNDLYAAVVDDLSTYQGHDYTHFNRKGSQKLAEQVVDIIEKNLSENIADQ